MSESKELKASGVVWKRLRKILLTSTIAVGAAAGIAYTFSGESFVLSADGLVTRERVAVAAPLEGRLKQVFVRPGDRVEAGQPIAIVESASVSRTLADLSIEKARISARMAQLEGRKKVIETLMPVADTTAMSVKAFLEELRSAKARGLAVDKSVHDISANYLNATERVLNLKAESQSIETELRGNKVAISEVSATYKNLKDIYNGGVLTAPVSGMIGSNVAIVGEVVSSTSNRVAQIYTGESYVLAYLPDSYLFDLQLGQPVAVKARGQTITASIDKILPVTEALPPEFQLPNRVRNRGQLVRIALEDPSQFALEQKINVTSCYVSGCKTGVMDVVRRVGNSMLAWANDTVQQTRITEALTRALRENSNVQSDRYHR